MILADVATIYVASHSLVNELRCSQVVDSRPVACHFTCSYSGGKLSGSYRISRFWAMLIGDSKTKGC